MAYSTKVLILPDGQEYEFFGKRWFGICSTSASTATKYVTIYGLAISDLANGLQITVWFNNGNSASSTPSISLNNWGAKYIYRGSSGAGQYEWASGAIITFVYYEGYWYILDGDHANTTYWGKTRLTNSITNNQSYALTPKAVYDAGYVNASGAAAAAPVQSVNGQTGAVSLTIPTVPTDVSAFNNDAGYLTLADLPVWDGGVE